MRSSSDHGSIDRARSDRYSDWLDHHMADELVSARASRRAEASPPPPPFVGTPFQQRRAALAALPRPARPCLISRVRGTNFDGSPTVSYLAADWPWRTERDKAILLSRADAQALITDFPDEFRDVSIQEIETVCTKYPEIFAALKAPFPPDLLRKKTKKPKEGPAITLTYVDAHVVQDRLDEVLGPEHWEFSLHPWGTDLIGTLTIHLPDGTKLSKSDAAGRPKMGDQVDEPKGAATHVLRRCAMLFGVGRYLCYKTAARKSTIDDPKLRRDPAPSPAPAEQPATLPITKKAAPPKPERTLPEIKTARELFNFCKANGLLPKFGEIGRNAGLPPRIVDWTDGNARVQWELYVEALPQFGKNGTDG